MLFRMFTRLQKCSLLPCLQGVGNFVNTGILLILLCVFNVTTVANQEEHTNRLGGVWRTAFGLGLIPIVLIIFYRTIYLKVPCAARIATRLYSTRL